MGHSEGAGGGQVRQEPDEKAARIAQDLRDAGFSCETVNVVLTDTAVLRREK